MREAVFLFKDIKGVGHPLVAGESQVKNYDNNDSDNDNYNNNYNNNDNNNDNNNNINNK